MFNTLKNMVSFRRQAPVKNHSLWQQKARQSPYNRQAEFLSPISKKEPGRAFWGSSSPYSLSLSPYQGTIRYKHCRGVLIHTCSAPLQEHLSLCSNTWLEGLSFCGWITAPSLFTELKLQDACSLHIKASCPSMSAFS